MKWRYAFGVVLLCACLFSSSDSVSALDKGIVISEVQTGGLNKNVEDGKIEFVELFNNADADTVVDGWRVEYLSASHVNGIEPTRVIAELNGIFKAKSHLLIASDAVDLGADLTYSPTSSTGFMAKSGGHVRVVMNDGVVIDQLGWGTAKHPEGKQVAEIAAGSSSQRQFAQSSFIDSDNNYNDFKNLSSPSPAGGGLVVKVVIIDEPVILPPPVANRMPCQSLVVSEVMSNPNGDDSKLKSEFIELHNPLTTEVQLGGCSLKTSAASKMYLLPAETLAAGAYRTILMSESGLTLLNSGGSVTLSDGTYDTDISYPELGNDQSWQLIGDVWSLSDVATSGSENIITIIEEPISTDCPAGKFYNESTGRCKALEVSVSLKPCDVDEIRNEETNRCRKIVSATASLLPCESGYERNATTNRCRKVSSDTTELTPCDPGQERNPLTNRCRKALSASVASPAAQVAAQPSIGGMKFDNTQWFLLGGFGVAVLGYGLYEWRRELVGVAKMLAKFKPWK